MAAFFAELFDGLYQLAIHPEGSGNLGDILDVKLGGETLGAIEWLPKSLLGAVSFAGCFWAFFWLGLLQGIGFCRLHRTTPIRAAVALLLPFVIPLVLWVMSLLGVLSIEASVGP